MKALDVPLVFSLVLRNRVPSIAIHDYCDRPGYFPSANDIDQKLLVPSQFGYGFYLSVTNLSCIFLILADDELRH
jgi:hypothetical protein